ncbi:uncharacterized protein K460DRAFT_198483 [Cucurbitaria berberidis CBS 394.84]|uniref:Cyanovirin-N domain-containing protein n=1 Tax=Cucurbitaria berberidis CBS 394.84 TaxID=1168544 RepID=A0A9P4G9C6_9PLEO|nr:uncharacterized protein K460DRAFT_198483 [Cucurbitaria berberidis CBS 394.84]KAF1841090.1 hypothetical protein K460DRAFT_198483 [Cucurbitaria berberidis CBS 394.84]
MRFVASPLIAALTLLQDAASHESSTGIGNRRMLHYPEAARPRDGSIRVFSGDSDDDRSDAADHVLKLPNATDECHAKDRNICAELIIGKDSVNQQIRIDDNGCTAIKNAADVTAIKVFDCWCGLWNAADETACNNGDDEVVDELSNCAGLKTRKDRGWKLTPTHISCFRQTSKS